MKNKLFLICFLLTTALYAQVGINTTTPNAQLEIKSSSETTPANTDGIIIPKINAFPATNPTAAQQGMMVYLTTAVGANVPGFYYWDNTVTPTWKPVAGTGGTLDNAYDFGGAGLGKTITADAGAVLIDGTDGFVSTGTLGSGALASTGAGVKMFWYPRKAAFRAGSASGTQWDDANIGTNSVAFGLDITASGFRATAFGFNTDATATTATAFGSNTTASGSASTSFGSLTAASGSGSTSFGGSTTASGLRSTAFGFTTTASADTATAFGSNTNANGLISTAFGQGNTASSYGETVLGIGATNYTPALNGVTQFRTANATDRLLVVGNAIDANNNNIVDTAERSNALVILKNGNIGLGTSTPLSKVHIVDENVIPTGTAQGNLHVMSNNPQGADLGGTISLGGFSNTAATIATVFGTIEGKKNDADSGVQTGYLAFKSTTSGNLLEAMRIKNGNVGIGTLGPTTNLHVDGGFRYVDGNQGSGRVLVSNAAGNASWQTVAVSNGWGLTGNSAITAANFIGTTDPADDFRFRSRGSWAGMLGLNNTSFGRFSLSSTAGANNTALGFASLSNTTSGSNNIAVGFNSMKDNTTGDTNIAIGINSMANIESGIANIAIGKSAMALNSATTNYSNSNIAIGNEALSCQICVVSIGTNNIGIGVQSGLGYISSNSVFIGTQTTPFIIGNNQVILGNQFTSFAGIQVPWTTTSDHRYKNTILKTNLGLDFINNLNPVFYLRNNDERKKTEYGFIAQELEEALTKFGVTNTGMVEKSKDGMYGVRYNDLFAPIVKSIQELAEENKNLRLQLQSQQATNQSILERLAALEKK